MENKNITLNNLINYIENMRVLARDEFALQFALENLFNSLNLKFEREKKIAPGVRPDFMLTGGIAVEVKIKDSLSNLTRQIYKYLGEQKITAILKVSNKTRLMRLPKKIRGKSVYVALVSGGLG